MNIVDILDRLIAVSIDSEKRYRHAAKTLNAPALRNFSSGKPLPAKRPQMSSAPSA